MNRNMASTQHNQANNFELRGNGVAIFLASLLITSLIASTPASAQGRCEGLGDVRSIALTDWESGLANWAADRRQVANPSTFDTADWDVIGDLPDGRTGNAAFVQNVNSGDCTLDDETGVLMLDSPQISLPGEIVTPYISVNHWYWVETGWDGGNFKLSVNGGPFRIIPSTRIEIASYDDELQPAFDNFGLIFNTNPLAGEEAFTGASGDSNDGAWVQSLINLGGLAAPGDNITLRLDFGVDCDAGEVGWYVDEVEVYSCTGESPLIGCGNRILDASEECDDGNGISGDGCSSLCRVEDGWNCSDPVFADIGDPGFEAGTPNPEWTELSNNPIGTPICEVSVCGLGGGSGPAEGDFWAWFGGTLSKQEGTLSQNVLIPTGVSELTFALEAPICDTQADYMEVLLDNQVIFRVDGSSEACGVSDYVIQSVDIAQFADDSTHSLAFRSETFANGGGYSNFFVDSVAITPIGSQCAQTATTQLILSKNVVNDNGGTATASEWTLTASGPSSFSGAGPSVASPAGFSAGTYDLSESTVPGYSQDGDWACVGGTQNDGDTITVNTGESATCTVNNNDDPASLTLVKEVVNDNGGTTSADAWILSASGPSNLSGTTGVTSNAEFNAGTYDLSESSIPGYLQDGEWVCIGGIKNDGDTITVGLGESATCTVRNNDIPPALTLSVQLVNDDGGSATAEDWILEATGPTPISGMGPSVSSSTAFRAGLYTLSVTGGPAGYTVSDWTCDGGQQVNPNAVQLEIGQGATCSVVLDDFPVDSSINATHSGAWYDPDTSGQGLLIDIEPEQQYMFAAWYTFTTADSEHPFEQRWFTAQGNYDGNRADLVLYETLGGLFDQTREVGTNPVGTVTLEFKGCTELDMTYAIDQEGLSGQITLIRAIPGSEEDCFALSTNRTQSVNINAGMDGGWYEPATSGQGFLIDAYPDGDFIFVSWFTFGNTNASGQRWFTAQGPFDGSSADILLYETTGGSFVDPRKPSTDPVGTVLLEFADCENARLNYALTAEQLSGEIDLIRAVPGTGKRCQDLSTPQ